MTWLSQIWTSKKTWSTFRVPKWISTLHTVLSSGTVLPKMYVWIQTGSVLLSVTALQFYYIYIPFYLNPIESHISGGLQCTLTSTWKHSALLTVPPQSAPPLVNVGLNENFMWVESWRSLHLLLKHWFAPDKLLYMFVFGKLLVC